MADVEGNALAMQSFNQTQMPLCFLEPKLKLNFANSKCGTNKEFEPIFLHLYTRKISLFFHSRSRYIYKLYWQKVQVAKIF